MNKEDLVCGCMKVTVGDIEKAIADGAKSFEDVQTATKVGTGCGACVGKNRAFVAELLAK